MRTSIELAVVGTGWLMGGTVGLGTLIYALAIGSLVHLFLPLFTIGERGGVGRERGALPSLAPQSDKS